MSIANIYVYFHPSAPNVPVIDPLKLVLAASDVEIHITFIGGEGMKFTGFHSDDTKHQLGKHVSPRKITLTDLDTLPDCIDYTLSIENPAGAPIVTDPQIINNPTIPPHG